MKKILPLLIMLLLIITSCEKKDNDIFLKIGNDLEYRFSDIELYDTSTHIVYFRTEHDEFRNLVDETFTILDNGIPLYSGTLWPAYSSSWPRGPFIITPNFLGNFALKIDNWEPDGTDVRNDPGVLRILNQHNLLHSGLSVSSGSVEINGPQLMFRFSVTNHDRSGLLILDYNKTGTNLFHYFTNGLYIYDLTPAEVFSGNIEPQIPDPWDSWKMDWLSVIEPGETKEFTINYTIENSPEPGDYIINFEFPGLGYQISKDELYQGGNRIWLGGASIIKSVQIP